MKLQHLTALLVLLLPIPAQRGMAQVHRVAVQTTGISCGFCAVASEINFKRMPEVEQVAIRLSTETVTLTYKPGAKFAPQRIRSILQPLNVGIVEMHVSARGQVQQKGGRQLFIAGDDEFLLTGAPNTAPIALNTPLSIEGVLNDRSTPMELKILRFRPSEP